MLILVAACQLKVMFRRVPSFLYETVQEHHVAALIEIKKHPGNAVLGER
jgi:hypothetical protein